MKCSAITSVSPLGNDGMRGCGPVAQTGLADPSAGGGGVRAADGKRKLGGSRPAASMAPSDLDVLERCVFG